MSACSVKKQSKQLQHYAGEYVEYIRYEKARSENTIRAYTQDLNCFNIFLISKECQFSEFTDELILFYIRYLREKQQLKPATVRRRVLTLQSFCDWLVNKDHLVSSPFDDLTLDLTVPKRLPRPVDPLLIRKLVSISHLPSDELLMENPKWSNSTRSSQKQTTLLILQLILTTGIRVGEVSSIRIRDISTDGSTIHILGKGNKERLVYIENKGVATALSQYRQERATNASNDNSLFINIRGNELTPQVIRKRVKSICSELGTSERPTPHRFRHSAATLLIEYGVDMRIVQRLLGHASISTTELYTQVTDVSLREALRKADVLRNFS